ncbi:MalY/PatB family protein [Streptomyces fuscigenes]|uniref:MalY/PatB family protein n=1 Tax=Streptomyces fuscigenes TaxID=1528880 RepID=UPI001F364DB1|nr:aminotransferase class I/II-fold pyridoxal phosphate-dependent enzyme [Streptomyces fuscigenes]MCF3965434.1 aminotransferase class I/II-fold pyridoxal phosphate-dependent enzyme [Streptomyces fuscigenes]
MPHTSDRPSPFDTVDLAQLRRRHNTKWGGVPHDVLSLSVAETDFATAPPVTAALERALADGDLGYAPPDALGLPAAFAAFAGRHWDWHPDPAAFVPVSEVMVGVVEALRLLTAPGDRVVVETPAYGPYFRVLRETGRAIAPVPLLATPEGPRRDLEGLRRAFAGGATAMLLCHPHNPTGYLGDRTELTAVAALAAEYGVAVIADEIWAPLVLDGAAPAAGDAPGDAGGRSPFVPYATVPQGDGVRTVVMTSASKAYNIPGLKCALMLPATEAAAAALRGLPELLPFRIALLGVLAGQAAFAEGDAWLGDLRAHLRANRDLLTRLLAEHVPGAGHVPPDATYLAWVDLRGVAPEGVPAAAYVEERARVRLSDGEEYGAPGWARLNFGTSAALLEESVRRMGAL